MRPPVRARPWVLVLTFVLAAVGLGPSVAAGTSAGGTVRGTPLALLGTLVTARERPAGYDIGRFPHWRNADGDGCDTRAEVLIAESLEHVTIGAGCALHGGRWRSAYDGVVTRDAGTFDIDHMVPLKEASESGARGWSQARHQAYANDLGDARTLRAVTASSNRSKGDRSPDEWMPPSGGVACRYLGWWIAVKVRWRLTVDSTERGYLRDRLAACPAKVLTVHRA